MFETADELRLDAARMHLISGFIDTYLKLNREEERAFQASAQAIGRRERKKVMEIVTSWMEQGLERGRREGRQEGELELVLRLLTHRLGRLGPRLQSRIRSLPLDKLEALAEALLDFTAANDLTRWLDENETRSNSKPATRRTTKENRQTKSSRRG